MTKQDSGLCVMSWAESVDHVYKDPWMASSITRFLAAAEKVACSPIVQRVYQLADVGVKGRTWLDGRTWQAAPAVRECFALAMSDMNTAAALHSELPMLAAAYRLSGESRFLDRILAQLEEAVSWSPLQRPGWTRYEKDSRPFTDPKGDGNWLATGWGVVGIVDALQLLPESAVPDALLGKLKALLATEIVSCVDDWTVRRPWFYHHQHENPFTNQWVFPTVGFLRASLYLGREQHQAAYELGIAHLIRSLNAYGVEGAFVEGMGYGAGTVTLLLHAARATALAGDRRLVDHPFLVNFAGWLVQHYQPAGHFINSFDAFGAAAHPLKNGKRDSGNKNLLALAALSTDSADARWAMAQLEVNEPDNLMSFLAQTQHPPLGYVPPLWAKYEQAARVNWRSSWAEDASGVWVRGGHKDDQHDHPDRGHVNFIFHGKPLLIEAGTPAYHNPRIKTDYASGRGHNVLQVGEQLPVSRSVAPITVQRLDTEGGSVMVDATGSFKTGVQRWVRQVSWTADELSVADDIKIEQPEVLLFRWHLGTAAVPEITPTGSGYSVVWPDGLLTVSSDIALLVQVEPMPDHTLCKREWLDPDFDHLHSCLVIKTANPVVEVEIKMNICGR